MLYGSRVLLTPHDSIAAVERAFDTRDHGVRLATGLPHLDFHGDELHINSSGLRLRAVAVGASSSFAVGSRRRTFLLPEMHMSWIGTVPYEQSTGKLRALYDRVRGPGGAIDNILRVHGLRPHTLEGHITLYKNVLHHSGNRLPKWLLETLGVYVSLLNRCDYCVEHHWEGLRRLLRDDERADAIRAALESGEPETVFQGREVAALRYARELTENPAGVQEGLITLLREAGLDDGEILEVNQVVSYFAYANRTVLGLGVTTRGDILGLSPGDSEDPDNWNHG